jgi:type IV secretory pathway VirB6-like protein
MDTIIRKIKNYTELIKNIRDDGARQLKLSAKFMKLGFFDIYGVEKSTEIVYFILDNINNMYLACEISLSGTVIDDNVNFLLNQLRLDDLIKVCFNFMIEKFDNFSIKKENCHNTINCMRELIL